MPTEQGSDGSPYATPAVRSGAGGEIIAHRERGFRRWLAQKQRFVRALFLLGAYFSLTLFLISLVAFGGPTAVSNVLLAVFFVSLLSVYFLFQFRYAAGAGGRFVWQRHHAPDRARWKNNLAFAVWSLAVIALIFAALYARAHIHK